MNEVEMLSRGLELIAAGVGPAGLAALLSTAAFFRLRPYLELEGVVWRFRIRAGFGKRWASTEAGGQRRRTPNG